MGHAAGCHHVALVTRDLAAFTDFWCGIFDGNVEWRLAEGPMRHAMVALGPGLRLHPFELGADHPEAAARPEIFARGHIDHFAVDIATPDDFETVRRRLVDAGASDGRLIDWGQVVQCPFTDPDGMDCEISIVRQGGEILTYEEMRRHDWPVPLADVL